MSVINILAPVFLLVCLGVLLKNSGFMNEDFFEQCAKFTYWIALPALLFYKISYAEFDLNATWRISAAMIISSIIIAVAAWALSFFLKLENNLKKTFIQTSFHCNTAFVGLPVIMYVVSGGIGDAKLTDAASVALAPMIPVISIMSIIVMGGKSDGGKIHKILSFIKNVYKNPLVIACLSGVFMYTFKLELPSAINRGISALTPVALPLALISIGASLKFKNAKGDLILALTAAGCNVIILPLVGVLICRFLELTRDETLVALIFLACPTASSSYIYARQLNGDAHFAGKVIVISTIISILPLLALLLFWR
jgi:predicted permease